MENRYKITIFGKHLYKEVEISPDTESLTIGTSIDADVRLRKEMYFESVNIELIRQNEELILFCNDNIYFNLGDSRKLIKLKLEHGMTFKVCYQESANELFDIEFMIDFDYQKKDYDRIVDISEVKNLKISSYKDADVIIDDPLFSEGEILLEKKDNSWMLTEHECRYGIFVNGEKIKGIKKIKDYDFISIVGYSFFIKKKYLYMTTDKKVRIGGLVSFINIESSSAFEYPKFNRSTRIQYELIPREIEILQPPVKPQYRKKSILFTIIPTLVMLAMIIVLRGIMGGGGTFVIYSAVSMSMGGIMSVITYIQDKKQFNTDVKEREENYKKYIEEKEQEIMDLRDNEEKIRNKIFISLEDGISYVTGFDKRLFEKSVTDKDFLKIYLGTGTVESVNPVQYTKNEFVDKGDVLSMMPEELALRYKYIEDAPIVADFNEDNGVGIVGKNKHLMNMLKNITLDIAIRHFYKDVQLVYLLSGEFIRSFKWVRWFQNSTIICDEESRNVFLENIYKELSLREMLTEEQRECTFDKYYVVFVTDTAIISNHPVSKYIMNAKRYGFTFVFLAEHEEMIPIGCNEIIHISHETGTIMKSDNGDAKLDFKYNVVSDSMAEKIALRLSPVYVDEVSLEGQLTKNISMFEMLGIISVEDLDLKQRWDESKVYKSLSAPIGVKSGNEIVKLNLSDKGNAHGPHGLVAGTTGSGKSEILQTYILSMVSLFHPYDVGFVIIDFKGGGMANQFASLPHLIGTITNIDGREIDRSLLSIKAELVKRQEMFMEAGVNHINDYIQLYKAGKVNRPMPHLIMIVDEFAELKAEYPDFMKELISAARIGRTLGVHLILATQKPAGVVDAQIWSNSKFKLCLKVQTKEDSNEVLKSPLAAEIVEPGRAYFQVGNNEIFELIQSAYSGGLVPDANEENRHIFEINELNLWGKKKCVYTNKKVSDNKNQLTQLDAIVNYIELYCKSNNIKKLPGICLPSLEKIVNTEKLTYERTEDRNYEIPLGVFDDPQMQRQGEYSIDLSRDNVYIVGSAQMGKTVLLQTMAYGIIRKYSPEEVNLYIVDCGSMVLSILEESVNVGGVVLPNEEEKCKNLFKMLNTIVVERKKMLSGKGVGNFASYLEAGYKDMPLIVVMIDNMSAFKEYFPDQTDMLNSLSREAQGVGISFVITAATSNALSYRVQANFGKKIALNCNDKSEYSNVFGHCKMTPLENAGRGLVMIDKRIMEWQAAIFGKDKKEAERSRELKEFVSERNKQFKKHAPKIPMVPERMVLLDEMKQNAEKFRNERIIPIGMRYDNVEYDMLDMVKNGSLSLIGDNESRIRFIKMFMAALAKNIVFHNAQAIVIDDKQKNLGTMSKLGFVREYTNDVSEGLSLLMDYYNMMTDMEDEEDDEDTILNILIINNPDIIRQINTDKNMSKELSAFLKKANEMKAFMLLSHIDNSPVGFNASDLLKTLKEERKGILFAPVTENKFYDINGRLRADAAFDNSMGYHFDGGVYYRIKLFE